jgi:hypothetical protein
MSHDVRDVAGPDTPCCDTTIAFGSFQIFNRVCVLWRCSRLVSARSYPAIAVPEEPDAIVVRDLQRIAFRSVAPTAGIVAVARAWTTAQQSNCIIVLHQPSLVVD